MSERRSSLAGFFEPASIAVVGASDAPGKWGYALARGALRGEGRRDVYLINPTRDSILGRPVYRSLDDLPAAPELVVLAIPAHLVDGAVDAALACGARAIIAITSGFAESGPGGRVLQDDIVRRVRDAGAAILGPNCMGIADTGSALEVGWFQLGGSGIPPGAVGIVSQSGQVATDLVKDLQAVGLGVSRIATIGNQADVAVSDIVDSLADHDATEVIAVYCEDFGDGRAFIRAADRARRNGKPVVIFAAGGGPAPTRASRQHTASTPTAAAITGEACRLAGAIKVSSAAELFNVVQVLVRVGAPRGRRLALLTDSGGLGVVAATLAEAVGLDVVPFSDPVRAQLREATDNTAGVGNPVDSAHAGIDPLSWERMVRVAAESGEVDALLMLGSFGIWHSEQVEGLIEIEAQAARGIVSTVARCGVPLLVHSACGQTAPVQYLRDAGCPVFDVVDGAIAALSLVCATSAPEGGAVPKPNCTPAPVSQGAPDVAALLAGAGVAPATQDIAREASDIELTVTTVRDSRFGPVLLLALGGAFTSLGSATNVGFAPMSEADVTGLLKRSGLLPLLRATGTDLDRLHSALASISEATSAHPSVAVLEVDPLIVSSHGLVALNTRMETDPSFLEASVGGLAGPSHGSAA